MHARAHENDSGRTTGCAMNEPGTHGDPAAYAAFFARAGADPALGGCLQAHPWQIELGADGACCDRLIRIPTGFGKTLGVLVAWLWHRVVRNDDAWPQRLVWCLPMRVLVEQTEAEVRAVLGRLNRLCDGSGDHAGNVGVHLLMGGADAGDWHLYPEHPAVLIGTQDMLLSRALNRGYGAPRARWPMEFGLLNQDCLWVMDEVQLMDVGLATSGQLQAFRRQDAQTGKDIRPCRTWWMSATLQPSWLKASPEMIVLGTDLERDQTRIASDLRIGPLWEDVHKPCHILALPDATALAGRVAGVHVEHGRGRHGPTVVVVNTVKTAVEVHAHLKRDPTLADTDLRLVHSRFRGAERAAWRAEFLHRAACAPGTDRIIIATQVIEAGVDISAGVLFTELAPWASLVQRFGRAARWGGTALVEVIDFQPANDKAALPYTLAELDAARSALSLLNAVAPRDLESFEETNPQLLASLYPYVPRHLLLRHELDELFDTTPDLSGADVDISRFIRSGEERDLQVFWVGIDPESTPDRTLRPSRDALCNVPFLAARDWLCGKETSTKKAPRLAQKKRAWVWSYLDGDWRRAERKDMYPGQTLLVAADTGGYEPAVGWAPGSTAWVPVVAAATPSPEEQADSSEDDETLSATARWQTIAVHGAQVGATAADAAHTLGLGYPALLHLAGRWHDAGKALAPFQNSMQRVDGPARNDIAKAPKTAWVAPGKLYPDPPHGRRRGLRHELASTLALFAVLTRHRPDHPALLGPWRGLLHAAGMQMAPVTVVAQPPNPLEQEILDLSADDFDLLAYLVCSHHGKVRIAWHASPADQQAADHTLRIRGVRDGEVLPSLPLATVDGRYLDLPASELRLDAAAAGLNPCTGRGWTERVLNLLDRHGPFTLAYLEALLRAADQRASRNPVADPLLETDNATRGLETSDRELAQIAGGGAPPSASARDSASRGELHGNGERAGERATHPRPVGTQDPGTRLLDTTLGVLSYAQLAPHLAERAGLLEADIADRVHAARPLDEALILDYHRRLCGDLVPVIAGRWRSTDVQVGAHLPPPAWQVPMQMREFCADLAARVAHAPSWSADRLLELLVFAEGRLLHIHPFTDFNGRLTRLFLIELLYRLELPIVDTAVSSGAERQAYFAALRAYDAGDPAPLAAVWRHRFEKEA